MASSNSLKHLLFLTLVILIPTLVLTYTDANSSSIYNNLTNQISNTDIAKHKDDKPEVDGVKCQEGLLLSVWMPQVGVTLGDRISRGLVYFLALSYLFIGVSIVSDRFMAAIEVITSQEKEVKIRKKDGEVQIIVVRVWNETVANLTLMALGSSAPEILLSIIEIIAKNFKAGDLGPGTIVGSAAYNLFVIIAICILVIPNGEVRKIKHLRVFFVTATWSIFAYIWLYLILASITPGRVDVWEGVLTFLFFPATVLTAYIAERRLLIYKYIGKRYRMNKRGVIVQVEGETAMEMNNREDGHLNLKVLEENGVTEEVRDFEEARREYISTLKDLRKKFPQNDLEHLEIMAHEQLMNKGPKSRAFYRIQATRKMMGSGNIMRKISERAQSDLSEVKAELQRLDIDDIDDESICKVYFEPGHYTVMENCGEFEVRVVRRGDLSFQVSVDYETEDGSAEAGSDYIGKKGILIFPPGVDEQRFKIEVIDDELFEQDEHFYVRLSNVTEPAVLSMPKVATVMILDDDHGGIFAFGSKDHELVESVGTYELKVQRFSGARGKVVVPYWTEDGTAKAGKDYERADGILEFDNNEIDDFDNKCAEPNCNLKNRSVTSTRKLAGDEITSLLETAVGLKGATKTTRKLLQEYSIHFLVEGGCVINLLSAMKGGTDMGASIVNVFSNPTCTENQTRQDLKEMGRFISELYNVICVSSPSHSLIEAVADGSKVPVINIGSFFYSPIDAFSFALTLYETFKKLRGLTVGIIASPNPYVNSLICALPRIGVNVRIICMQNNQVLSLRHLDLAKQNEKLNETTIKECSTIAEVIEGADCIVLACERHLDTKLKLQDFDNAAKDWKIACKLPAEHPVERALIKHQNNISYNVLSNTHVIYSALYIRLLGIDFKHTVKIN